MDNILFIGNVNVFVMPCYKCLWCLLVFIIFVNIFGYHHYWSFCCWLWWCCFYDWYYSYPCILLQVDILLEAKGCLLTYKFGKTFTLQICSFFFSKLYDFCSFWFFLIYIENIVLIIYVWIFLYKNNLQIGDIDSNLKLLPCIVKRHFKTVLHLHVSINQPLDTLLT
jgi:hypothetical protein